MKWVFLVRIQCMVKGPTFLYDIDTGFKKSLVMKSARKFCVIYLPIPRTQMKSQNLAYLTASISFCVKTLL